MEHISRASRIDHRHGIGRGVETVVPGDGVAPIGPFGLHHHPGPHLQDALARLIEVLNATGQRTSKALTTDQHGDVWY